MIDAQGQYLLDNTSINRRQICFTCILTLATKKRIKEIKEKAEANKL